MRGAEPAGRPRRADAAGGTERHGMEASHRHRGHGVPGFSRWPHFCELRPDEPDSRSRSSDAGCPDDLGVVWRSLEGLGRDLQSDRSEYTQTTTMEGCAERLGLPCSHTVAGAVFLCVAYGFIVWHGIAWSRRGEVIRSVAICGADLISVGAGLDRLLDASVVPRYIFDGRMAPDHLNATEILNSPLPCRRSFAACHCATDPGARSVGLSDRINRPLSGCADGHDRSASQRLRHRMQENRSEHAQRYSLREGLACRCRRSSSSRWGQFTRTSRFLACLDQIVFRFQASSTQRMRYPSLQREQPSASSRLLHSLCIRP